MVEKYIVTIPERIDAIAHRIFGHTDGTVEAILTLNPSLPFSPFLPTGTEVRLPESPAPQKHKIRLWD